VTLNVEAVFTNTTGFNYTFWSQVSANSTSTYHTSTMPQIPSPFTGTLTLYADNPFTAAVTGYDYPGSVTPTPTGATSTPTASATTLATATTTASPTPTGVRSPTATPTGTGAATLTPTATPTRGSGNTPTATGTSTPTAMSTATPGAVLFSDGFEEASFAAGGWTTQVSGTGASAQLVATPVYAGAQAGQFATTSQASGQQAFATASFAWPSGQVATAQGMVYLQGMAIQFVSKLFSLETRGPNAWGPRAAFGVGPSTWYAIYTTRDGTIHYDDTGWAYQGSSWYSLGVTVDYRGSNPVLTWEIGGQQIYQVVDTTSGGDLDQPVALTLGLGPGWWGNNAGTATFDQVSVAAQGPATTPTATPTGSVTATGTATRTASPTATSTPTAPPTRTGTATASATATSPPTASRTASATTSATSTPSATGTASPTASLTPTNTLGPTITPTATATPPATGTPNGLIFNDGFEETSFAAGGWATAVSGAGASAQLVATPVYAGAQAAEFTTSSQTSGQRAYAIHTYTWPADNVVTASGEVWAQMVAQPGVSKVFGLQTEGPNPWGPRAVLGLGPSTFYAIYTTSDGVVHQVDTGASYQSGTWYHVGVTVDYRGGSPILTFAVNKQVIEQVVDTTGGTNLDLPVGLLVGYGPAGSAANDGSVVVDQVQLTSWSAVPTPTPTPTP
jgi:hypothetical protein